LKTFFSENLDKGKLLRTKDVSYNKESGEIEQIPALVFMATSRHFSLRNMDHKYVSTLKSMTPRRTVSDLEKLVSVSSEAVSGLETFADGVSPSSENTKVLEF
jgi:hypothetical protein